MPTAIIVATRIAAAHDGAAELVVTLHHDNGGQSEVTLDEAAAGALFEACGTRDPDELAGHGWEKVRDALSVSSSRFANPN